MRITIPIEYILKYTVKKSSKHKKYSLCEVFVLMDKNINPNKYNVVSREYDNTKDSYELILQVK